MRFCFFTYVNACYCFVKSKLGPKISRNEVSTKPPMGIYNLKWNYLGFKVSNWRWFWYSKRYFGPKMTKIRFQIKPHTFFFILDDGFSKTLARNLPISQFCGYLKLKTKGRFHWNQGYSTEKEALTRGIRLRRRPSASSSFEIPGFGLLLSRNPWFQTTFSFYFWTPKIVKLQICW